MGEVIYLERELKEKLNITSDLALIKVSRYKFKPVEIKISNNEIKSQMTKHTDNDKVTIITGLSWAGLMEKDGEEKIL